MKSLLTAAATLALAACATVPPPQPVAAGEPDGTTPADMVALASEADWTAIAPEDLLVMDLAPDTAGQPRRIVIQLMPEPLSQGWVRNVRTLARAHWWDGTTVYRVVDNWVAQWGDGEDDPARAKPLPDGLLTVPESEYVTPRPRDGRTAAFPGITDPYAPHAGFRDGFPVAWNEDTIWPTHCYASVGVARDLSPNTGTGAELYAVIGHAPRRLDRNIAVIGRVIAGIEHLSVLPRGTGDAGVYADAAQRVPILRARLADELPQGERPRFRTLSPTSDAFARMVGVTANRFDSFYRVPAGGVDVCGVSVPIERLDEGDAP